MLRSDIPPRGMPGLFRKMKAAAENAGASEVPDFLSTHPSMHERLKIAAEKIAAKGAVPEEMPEGLRRIWLEIQRK